MTVERHCVRMRREPNRRNGVAQAGRPSGLRHLCLVTGSSAAATSCHSCPNCVVVNAESPAASELALRDGSAIPLPYADPPDFPASKTVTSTRRKSGGNAAEDQKGGVFSPRRRPSPTKRHDRPSTWPTVTPSPQRTSRWVGTPKQSVGNPGGATRKCSAVDPPPGDWLPLAGPVVAPSSPRTPAAPSFPRLARRRLNDSPHCGMWVPARCHRAYGQDPRRRRSRPVRSGARGHDDLLLRAAHRA